MSRDTLIIAMRRMGIRVFFGGFLYLLAAYFLRGFYDLPTFAFVIFFFTSLLFLGLSFLPPRFSREYAGAWLFFSSFLFIVLGGGTVFLSLSLFAQNLQSPFAIVGAISFIGGIVLMMVSSLLAGDWRDLNDVHNVIFAFNEVSKALHLYVQDKSDAGQTLLEARGNLEGDLVLLTIKNQYAFSQHFSFLNWKFFAIKPKAISTITITTDKPLSSFRIQVIGEAVEIQGLDESKKEEVANYINKTQLKDFDFDLQAEKDRAVLEVRIGIEEKQLWKDYIGLMQLTLRLSN